MHQLYLVMKDCEEPTADQILYASGKKPLDSLVQAYNIQTLEAKATGIREAFAKQQAAAVVWNLWDGLCIILTELH